MMPAMMVAPVNAVVMAIGAMLADDARAVRGQYPVAACAADQDRSGIGNGIVVIGGIVIRIVVVIDAADKNPVMPMEAVPHVAMAHVSVRPSNTPWRGNERRRPGPDRATANKRAAHAATAEAAAAAKATTAVSAATAVTATTNLDRRYARDWPGDCTARIDRRHRVSV